MSALSPDCVRSLSTEPIAPSSVSLENQKSPGLFENRCSSSGGCGFQGCHAPGSAGEVAVDLTSLQMCRWYLYRLSWKVFWEKPLSLWTPDLVDTVAEWNAEARREAWGRLSCTVQGRPALRDQFNLLPSRCTGLCEIIEDKVLWPL